MDRADETAAVVAAPDEAATMAHGRRAADGAVPGAVFALVGDLGAGKTHWTKGFVAGMGADDVVTSPTFGLVHEYRGGRLPVFHFDFHRLASAAEMVAAGWDDYLDESGVVIAEWADRFPELIPPHASWIHIEAQNDGSRQLRG